MNATAVLLFMLIAVLPRVKAQHINPQTRLADGLARIADHPARKLDELVPWEVGEKFIKGE